MVAQLSGRQSNIIRNYYTKDIFLSYKNVGIVKKNNVCLIITNINNEVLLQSLLDHAANNIMMHVQKDLIWKWGSHNNCIEKFATDINGDKDMYLSSIFPLQWLLQNKKSKENAS